MYKLSLSYNFKERSDLSSKFNEIDLLSRPFSFLYKIALTPSLSDENPFAEFKRSPTVLLLEYWKEPSMLTAPPILTISAILSFFISLKEILSPSLSFVFVKSFLPTSIIFFEKSSNLSIKILLF